MQGSAGILAWPGDRVIYRHQHLAGGDVRIVEDVFGGVDRAGGYAVLSQKRHRLGAGSGREPG